MYKIDKPNTYMTEGLEGASVFIDPNMLAEDGTATLATQVWSKDGKYMAY